MKSENSYRPDIDGLRALAVISVIAYHAQFTVLGQTLFMGGWVGVDVFFVISGYLIFRILIKEYETNQKINFLNFWHRRIRRILPALSVVVLLVTPFCWFFFDPITLGSYGDSVVASILFITNLFLYSTGTNYGENIVDTLPLVHTWSVSVEEQFYLVAPLVLLGILKLSEKQRRFILFLITFLSLMACVFYGLNDPVFAFYFPFSRFWEISAGGCLAVYEKKINYKMLGKWALQLKVAALASLLLVFQFYEFSNTGPGIWLLIPVIVTSIVLIPANADDFVRRALTNKWLVRIGLISYSLYLWHYPLFALARIQLVDLALLDKAYLIALTLVLSIGSFRFVEQPFRRSGSLNTKLIFSLVLAFICLTAAMFVTNTHNFSMKDKQLINNLSHEALYPEEKLVLDKCHGKFDDYCTFGNPKAVSTIIILGDSHAKWLVPPFVKAFGETHKVKMLTESGCWPVKGFQKSDFVEGTSRCSIAYQKSRYQYLSSIEKPTTVIVIGRLPLYLNRDFFSNGEGGIEGGGIWGQYINEDGMSFENEAVKYLEKLSKKHSVVLVYPIPEVGWNVPAEIMRRYLKDGEEFMPVTTSLRRYWQRTASSFYLLDRVDGKNIERVYPEDVFCSLTNLRCVTHDAVQSYYFDSNHLSSFGAEKLVNHIKRQLEK